jgi:N-succinyldiaminopimelate aminotransferase
MVKRCSNLQALPTNNKFLVRIRPVDAQFTGLFYGESFCLDLWSRFSGDNIRAMLNKTIELLTDYPFDQTRALLDVAAPPAGVEPVALSIGEPQHAPPPILAEAVAENAHLWGKYPQPGGTPELRQAITNWLIRRFKVPAQAFENEVGIIPVAGTREALYLIAPTVVPESISGQRPVVLIPNPLYHVYTGGAIMAGAEPVFMPATHNSGFIPNFQELDEATLRRTAFAYLCTPSNPQGAIADMDYLKDAILLARKHDFVLVVDECYSEIYDTTPPPGALEACAEIGNGYSNVLIFHSLSKRSSAASLRSGFVAGDANLIEAFRRLRCFSGATLPLPLQAASAALWNDEAHVDENRRKYRTKFDVAERVLEGRYGYYRPGGGFFLWLDVGNGEEAAFKLWTEAGIRVQPGAFMSRPDESGYNPGAAYIRVALVHETDVIEKALEQFVKILR